MLQQHMSNSSPRVYSDSCQPEWQHEWWQINHRPSTNAIVIVPTENFAARTPRLNCDQHHRVLNWKPETTITTPQNITEWGQQMRPTHEYSSSQQQLTHGDSSQLQLDADKEQQPPISGAQDPQSPANSPAPMETACLTTSPHEMDPAIQEQGNDLQEVLHLFRSSTSAPLSIFVLETPKYKKEAPSANNSAQQQGKPRQSPRLKTKLSTGQSIVKMAQNLVAKKCRIVQEDQSLDNLTLQQYLDMYKKPLTKEVVEAITTLTEVADKKKNRGGKSKKKLVLIKKGEKLAPTGAVV